MEINAKSVLSYWRNSLVDANCLNPNIKKNPYTNISIDNIKTGRLDKDTTTSLFKRKHGTNYSDALISNDTECNKEEVFVNVLICPRRAALDYEHYKQKEFGLEKEIMPLWIPGTLLSNGVLVPTDWQWPWVPRELLEPVNNNRLTIGNIEDLELFFTNKPPPEKFPSWADIVNFGMELLDFMPRGNLDFPNYKIMDTGCILLSDNSGGMSTQIVKLLDHLTVRNQIPPLLRLYAGGKEIPLKPLLNEREDLDMSLKHVGQMRKDFSLSPSQRETIHHFFSLDNGEILAVNGPPGTGKTTLLQSVVATMWVEAAIQKKDPPIIAAVSANNQPVTNIIDNFGMAYENNTIASQRWLPKIFSYGMYCPSEQAILKIRKNEYQIVKKSGNNFSGFFNDLENEEYLKEASELFLNKCTAYFQKPIASVNIACHHLHTRLKETIQTMEDGINKFIAWINIFSKMCHVLELTATVSKEDILSALDSSLAAVKEKIDSHKNQIINYQIILDELCNEEQNWVAKKLRWVQHLESEPVLWSILSFLSIFRRKILIRNKAFTILEKLECNTENIDDIEKAISKGIETATLRIKETKNNIQGLENSINKLVVKKDTWSQRKESVISANNSWIEWKSANNIINDPPCLFNELDILFRYPAFLLATHYWEARWLIETKKQLENKNNSKYIKKNVRDRIDRNWRRMLMLAPCIVSTVYKLPSMFSYWKGQDEYLLEYADLLIMDESGQVSPELASGVFALAQKALVVGDMKQIQPIWNIPQAVDKGNLVRHKVIENPDYYKDVHTMGITASSGCAMKIAQCGTQYIKIFNNGTAYPERGLFLSEHRRCQDTIISYCNELAYDGLLQPMAKPIPKKVNGLDALPFMGYAHIRGISETSGGSRQNNIEAETILKWIIQRKTYLEQVYSFLENKKKLPLKDIIAILTPFSAQAKLFKNKISEYEYKELQDLKIGTVHTLQGSERPVVIFSPVYTENDGNADSFFFNKTVNIINVAVSRAKYSFLVFGDMSIFDPTSRKAFGLLARYLFSNEENELTDIDPQLYGISPKDFRFDHLLGTEKHRITLKKVLEQARNQVIIASPFVRENAINDDKIDQNIQQATRRGVIVRVIYDGFLNRKNGKWIPGVEDGLDLLYKAGAILEEANRMHAKSLYMDQDLLTEGSFNWLSAVRRDQDSHPFARYEASVLVRGNLGEFINKALTLLNKKVLKKYSPKNIL